MAYQKLQVHLAWYSVAAAKAISQLVALVLANFSLVDHQPS